LSFFSNTQTKIFKRNVAWEYKNKTRSLSLVVRLKKQIYSKKKKSIPLREDEDALVRVVVTFVLPRVLFFLAPFREEEEEEEENKFGGR
jgi:phage-related protein